MYDSLKSVFKNYVIGVIIKWRHYEMVTVPALKKRYEDFDLLLVSSNVGNEILKSLFHVILTSLPISYNI